MSQGDYVATIGIECHVQLKTKTKLFAAVGNDAREAAPNTLISHICLGMPGALPVLNEAAIKLAIRAAFALNTEPQKFSAFDRKHYFYPDLPKGYQISQLYHPIITGGFVDIETDGQQKRIGITRAHLEEDAGKNTHPTGSDYSLVDLNRAGTPLLEIVSEPDIHSAAEAKAYAHELYLLMRYANVSDADLYYGNMRFDVNVSVSNDAGKLGNRTETKNLNSFRAVEKAVEYEISRQVNELEQGNQIVQETRGWDDMKMVTFSQRSKEDSHDYRYMPDPDIPPIVLDDEELAQALADMGLLPGEVRKALRALDMDESAVETMIDSVEIIDEIMAIINNAPSPAVARTVLLWFAGIGQTLISEDGSWHDMHLNEKTSRLLRLSQMQHEGALSSTAAKEIFADVLRSDRSPDEIAEEKNLLQVSDTAAIEAIVDHVIAKHDKAAQDVRNGEQKAIGFLVGQVMKESKGRANPPLVQKILKNKLLQ